MLKWEDFDRLRVIRKIKSIVSQWWGVEIFFADEKGNIQNLSKNNPPTFSNTVVNMILKKSLGFELLNNHAASIIKKLKKEGTITTPWEVGFDAVAFPIKINSDISGAVIASGFFSNPDRQKNILYKTLRDLSYVSSDIDKAIKSVVTISNEELGKFYELVELIASEIETLNEEISSRENKISELNKELGTRYRYDSMVGKSAPMQKLYSLLDKIKNSTSTVLIQGENGTGKELIAKAIHYNSPRKDKIFVIQNCSAFNDNLLESELFGHVKGSFTGAMKDKKGLFEMANGGTFFLDEIGDMSLTMQVKMLRVLQEGTFTPVGSTETKKVNVRIIAATNRNLKDMITNNEFRKDLFYRINVINIQVPSLKERKDDIPLLCEYFLDKVHKETGYVKKKLSKKTLAKLIEYDWAGNIRELENEIERLTVLSGEDLIIEPDVLSERILETTKKEASEYTGNLKDAIESLELELIKSGLERTNGNKSKLAQELGISRANLIAKVEKFGLDKKD